MRTYIYNRVHFVWSTKHRQDLIDPVWQDRLFQYMAGVSRKKKSKLIVAGGMPDHIHLLVSMSATISIAAMVNSLKANSSRWIRETFILARPFRWQRGYGAFSVSESSTARVTRYIQRQEQHHRRHGFQDELNTMLEEHNLAYDAQSSSV